MGAMTSRIPFMESPDETPPEEEYNVHGLYYWPGKCTPFSQWQTLLPDYPQNKNKENEIIPANTSVKSTTSETCSKNVSRPLTQSTSTYSDDETVNNDWLARLRPEYLNSLIQRARLRALNTLNNTQINRNRKRRHSNSSSISNSSKDAHMQDVKLRLFKNNSGVSRGRYDRNSGTASSALTSHRLSSDSSRSKPEDRWKHYNKYPFENIALSGGGMKGYAYIGAIKALEDAGVMPQIKRYAGSSAGAMCAAALAVGYTAQDICRCFFVDLNESITDQPCCVMCFIPKLYSKYGIHPAKKFFDGFGLVLAAKANGNVDLTFKQLYEMNGNELVIVVCNITKMSAEYCHHSTTPDLPIREAVRMSIAVPIVFEPVAKTIDGQVNYYIDGSTGDHFPMHCFDGPEVGANINQPANEKTLGFYVLSEKDAEHVLWLNTFGKEIPNKPSYMPDTKLARCQLKEEIKKRKKASKQFDEKTFIRQLEKFSRVSLETLGMKHYEAANKTHVKPNNILDYMVANLELLLNAQVVQKMKPNDEQRTIPINVGYMETHNYDVEPADREFMLKQGYVSAKDHLQQYMVNDLKKEAEIAQNVEKVVIN